MSEFMEVIEWFDKTGQEIVSRYPEEGSAEVKMQQCWRSLQRRH